MKINMDVKTFIIQTLELMIERKEMNKYAEKFLSAIESIFLSNDCAKLFNYLYLYDKYHYKYPIEEKTIDNAFSFIYNVLKTTIKDHEKQIKDKKEIILKSSIEICKLIVQISYTSR